MNFPACKCQTGFEKPIGASKIPMSVCIHRFESILAAGKPLLRHPGYPEDCQTRNDLPYRIFWNCHNIPQAHTCPYYWLRCGEHGLRGSAPSNEFAGTPDPDGRAWDTAVTRHRQGKLYCGGDIDTYRQRSCPHREGYNANEALGRHRICVPRRNSVQGRAKCH